MKVVLGFCSLLATASAIADTEKKPLELSAELGLLSISGNSESTSVISKLDVKQDFKAWRTAYLIEGLYKKDTVRIENDGENDTEEEVLSAKKYFASTQADYKLDEEYRGLFLFGSYLYDKFSGYEYQATVAAGYSDRLFKTEKQKFDYSIGPGVAFTKLEDTDVDGSIIEGESEDNPVVRLAFAYLYTFKEGVKFTQDFASDVSIDSDENTKSKAVSAISAKLNNSLSLKVSYTLMHNSEVPEDIEDTDTEVAVTIVYSL